MARPRGPYAGAHPGLGGGGGGRRRRPRGPYPGARPGVGGGAREQPGVGAGKARRTTVPTNIPPTRARPTPENITQHAADFVDRHISFDNEGKPTGFKTSPQAARQDFLATRARLLRQGTLVRGQQPKLRAAVNRELGGRAQKFVGAEAARRQRSLVGPKLPSLPKPQSVARQQAAQVLPEKRVPTAQKPSGRGPYPGARPGISKPNAAAERVAKRSTSYSDLHKNAWQAIRKRTPSSGGYRGSTTDLWKLAYLTGDKKAVKRVLHAMPHTPEAAQRQLNNYGGGQDKVPYVPKLPRALQPGKERQPGGLPGVPYLQGGPTGRFRQERKQINQAVRNLPSYQRTQASNLDDLGRAIDFATLVAPVPFLGKVGRWAWKASGIGKTARALTSPVGRETLAAATKAGALDIAKRRAANVSLRVAHPVQYEAKAFATRPIRHGLTYGALAAGGGTAQGRRVVGGSAQALWEHPRETGRSTLNAFVAMVTGPVALGVGALGSAKRAAQVGIEEATGKKPSYSWAQVRQPLWGAGDMFYQSGKQMVNLTLHGSQAEIEKAVADEFGLVLPLTPLWLARTSFRPGYEATRGAARGAAAKVRGRYFPQPFTRPHENPNIRYFVTPRSQRKAVEAGKVAPRPEELHADPISAQEAVARLGRKGQQDVWEVNLNPGRRLVRTATGVELVGKELPRGAEGVFTPIKVKRNKIVDAETGDVVGRIERGPAGHNFPPGISAEEGLKRAQRVEREIPPKAKAGAAYRARHAWWGRPSYRAILGEPGRETVIAEAGSMQLLKKRVKESRAFSSEARPGEYPQEWASPIEAGPRRVEHGMEPTPEGGMKRAGVDLGPGTRGKIAVAGAKFRRMGIGLEHPWERAVRPGQRVSAVSATAGGASIARLPLEELDVRARAFGREEPRVLQGLSQLGGRDYGLRYQARDISRTFSRQVNVADSRLALQIANAQRDLASLPGRKGHFRNRQGVEIAPGVYRSAEDYVGFLVQSRISGKSRAQALADIRHLKTRIEQHGGKGGVDWQMLNYLEKHPDMVVRSQNPKLWKVVDDMKAISDTVYDSPIARYRPLMEDAGIPFPKDRVAPTKPAELTAEEAATQKALIRERYDSTLGREPTAEEMKAELRNAGLDKAAAEQAKEGTKAYHDTMQDIRKEMEARGLEEPAVLPTPQEALRKLGAGQTISAGKIPEEPYGMEPNQAGVVQASRESMGQVNYNLKDTLQGFQSDYHRQNLARWVSYISDRYSDIWDFQGRKQSNLTLDQFEAIDRSINPEGGGLRDKILVSEGFLKDPYNPKYDKAMSQIATMSNEDIIGTGVLGNWMTPEIRTTLADSVGKLQAEGRGARFVSFDREAINAVLDQLRRGDQISRTMRLFGRLPAVVILSTSLAWMVMQPIAEGLTLALGTSARDWIPAARNVYRVYKHGTKQERLHLAIQSDAIVGHHLLPGEYQRFVASDKPIRNTPGWGIISNAGHLRYPGMIDRWKGNLIRDIGTAAEVRRITRQADDFIKGVHGTYQMTHRIANELKGKSFEDQMTWLNDHPREARVLQDNIDDMLGNWNALTSTERTWAPFTLFYPFLRWSIDWTFRTFPKNHPIKFAIAMNMAAATTNQIQQMMGGNPSFYSQIVNVPYFGEGPGKPTSMLSATRFVPGQNAITQAAGQGDFYSMIGIFNPALTIPVMAFFGKNQFGGESKDTLTNIKKQIAGMSVPLQMGAELTGAVPVTPGSELYRQVGGGEQLYWERRGLFPPIPYTAEQTRQVAHLSRAQEAAYKTLPFRPPQASGINLQGQKGGAKARADKEAYQAWKAAAHAKNRGERELRRFYKAYGIKPEFPITIPGENTGPGGIHIQAGTPTAAAPKHRAPSAPPSPGKPSPGVDSTAKVPKSGAGTPRGNRQLASKFASAGLEAPQIAAIAKAAKAHGVPPEVLASISEVESNHGRNTGPSSAGAQGPFQFMPATWNEYAQKRWGKNASRHSINNYEDAADLAAYYLKASGWRNGDVAAQQQAVYSYNHSDAYVQQVLQGATKYRDRRWGSVKPVGTWGPGPKGKISGDTSGITPDVEKLGRKIAGRVGPLNIISGFRSGATTSSGNVSDHASGNAIDIAALDRRAGGSAKDEARGDAIARAAAKAAGASKSDIQKFIRSGGVLDVNSPSGYRVQIIWKTPAYGGHDNHVHVGIRAGPGVNGVTTGGGGFAFGGGGIGAPTALGFGAGGTGTSTSTSMSRLFSPTTGSALNLALGPFAPYAPRGSAVTSRSTATSLRKLTSGQMAPAAQFAKFASTRKRMLARGQPTTGSKRGG